MTGTQIVEVARPNAPTEQPRGSVPWLLAALCFILPALPTYVVIAGPLKGNGAPARIIALMMFGLVLLGFLLGRRDCDQRRTLNPGVVILLVYLLMWLLPYAAGILDGGGAELAANRTRGLITLVAHVGVGLYVVIGVRTPRQRRIVLGALAAGLAFACLVGFLQGVSTTDLRYFFEPPGFVVNATDLELTERGGAFRVRGTSGHPIEFSVLAAVLIPLSIHLARHAAHQWTRLLAVLALVIALLALPAAISRTGVIALIAAMIVYMWAFRVRVILVSAGVLAAAIGVYMAMFPTIINALWGSITGAAEDDSISGRTADYAQVGDVFRAHTWLGLGVGSSDPTVFGYLDNEWAQALVQGGLVGLTAMTVLMAGAIFGISACLRRVRSRSEREEAWMLGAMAMAIISSSFTFDLFAFEQAALVFFIVFGLLWAPFAVDAPQPSAREVSSRSQRVVDRFARIRASTANVR